MFRKACALAMNFTAPVVVSLRTDTGLCRSTIGTFIVVNEEGWCITAHHIIEGISEVSRAHLLAQQAGAPVQNRQQRRAARKAPAAPKIVNWSAWWGFPGRNLELDGNIFSVPMVDLAVFKLKNFDGKLVSHYPEFKDPTKDFHPGASLCRMGFPFYDVGTEWDQAAQGFNLKNVPLPIFPNEGILSRSHERVPVDPATGQPHPPPPFPTMMIETSHAGIKGQSGGPIFDEHCAIWGLQSATASYPMDFGMKEQQYYHVGVGVSSATIIGVFKHRGIAFKMSNH